MLYYIYTFILIEKITIQCRRKYCGSLNVNDIRLRKKKKKMHRPGIGPGPPPWQGEILPLDQRCLLFYFKI